MVLVPRISAFISPSIFVNTPLSSVALLLTSRSSRAARLGFKSFTSWRILSLSSAYSSSSSSFFLIDFSRDLVSFFFSLALFRMSKYFFIDSSLKPFSKASMSMIWFCNSVIPSFVEPSSSIDLFEDTRAFSSASLRRISFLIFSGVSSPLSFRFCASLYAS